MHLLTVLLLVCVAAVQPQHVPLRIAIESDEADTDPLAVCSDQIVAAKIDALVPRTNSAAATVLISLQLDDVQLPGAVLFSAAGHTISLRANGVMTLSTATGSIDYLMGLANSALEAVSVAFEGSNHQLCINLMCLQPQQGQGVIADADGWVSTAWDTAPKQLGDITLGSPSGRSMAGTVHGVWILPASVTFTLAPNQTVADAIAAHTLPAAEAPTVSLQVQTAAPVVGEAVSVTVSAAAAAGHKIRARVVFFGAAPRDCLLASCGTVNKTFSGSGHTLEGTATAYYSRAGRYIIRVQAADEAGGWASQDVAVIVRKAGDSSGRAACCRSTGLIITQQLGRPIDPVTFRPSWLASSAAAVGWESGYLQGSEDLEAERLFDYSVLAPLETGPVSLVTCADRHLAGLGSPKVYGAHAGSGVSAASNQGHNKRVAILPQGFDWTSTLTGWNAARLPTCVTHWSDWMARSPHGQRIGGKTVCSYTCTPDGVMGLTTMTGTTDRLAEAIIEGSYGRLSLLPDPVVLPTQYLPQVVPGCTNAFCYSSSLIQSYLQNLGYDLYRDFHTVVVLSPLPTFINDGRFRAWADAGGSPLIYVMRCNPQHYYLTHEIGHRLGMPHAVLYKLTEERATAAVPTNKLLAAGVMEDSYSDRLDIMACCKGDYSLYNRILAGWVPGAERVTLGLSDMAAAAGVAPVTHRYTLWPYDRPESKGQLKGVTLRIEGGKVLVLGYRSLPFWQDVRIAAGRGAPAPLTHAPEHMRDNLHGLSVEYARRLPGSSSWSARGLLDFNMAFARYPSALPPSAGSFPPDPPGAAFTLLREGDAWLDEEHNLLLAVERLVPCQGGALPVHRYSVYNFYGFRGENPGQEAVRRADYTGYAEGLRCLQLRVVTGVTAAPGTLDVKLRLQGLDDQNRLLLGGQQCGFPVRPRLRIDVPSSAAVLSIVWRDNHNRTVALDSREVELPPLQPLDEASASSTEQCNTACDWRYHVKVLAADGAQTQVDIAVGSVSLSTISLTATYRYYLASSIPTAVEYHAVPVLPLPAARAGAAEGRALLQQPITLQAASAQVHPSSSLPDFSCSGQWSVSLNLQVPSSAVARAGSSTPLLSVLSDAPGGWPSVSLRVAAAGSTLAVQWGPTAALREQPVSIRPNKDGWASVHVAVVRDGSRLGVWLDDSGSWLLQDVWCVPASTSVRYCTQPAADPPPDSSFRALRLGSTDGPSSGDIIITSARVYNYALPRLSLAAESGCVEDGTCGRFLVSGWAPPAPSSIPAGSISGSTVEAVGSTPIQLRATSHYLLVGPWSPCSARCGGGWAQRDVRCMRLGATSTSPPIEVPLGDCPLVDEAPVNSKRCNTVACPKATFQLLAGRHSACGASGCQLLPSAADMAQLVCVSALGQPLAVGQCCPACNASDWDSLQWTTNLTSIQRQVPVVLGSDVTQLQLPVASAESFGSVFVQGSLAQACAAPVAASCTQTVRWQLGAWGVCSSRCEGGHATRTAVCVDSTTGSRVEDARCITAFGRPSASLMRRACSTQPCAVYTWKVGPWSACSGDAAVGRSSRAVSCTNQAGQVVTAGPDTCATQQPASSALCWPDAAQVSCRPARDSAAAGSVDADCNGRGLCSTAGCDCKDGWRGQFCEVSPRCKGVMDRRDKCCGSGVLDATGECCPAGSVLDAVGTCCTAGQVDVCGVCGGTSWTVDVRGVCCGSMLDAYLLCCTSGAVDECGVCDGDGTSCSLHLRLLLQVPQGTNLTDGAAQPSTGKGATYPASAQLTTWLQTTLQQIVEAKAPSAVIAGASATAAWSSWAPAVVKSDPFGVHTSPAHGTRHLAAEDTFQLQPEPCGSLPTDCNHAADSQQRGSVCPKQVLPITNPAGLSICSGTLGSPQQQGNSLAASVLHASVRLRQLLQVPGGTASSQHVELNAVLRDPSSLAPVGSLGAGLLGVGQVLALGLEQQAGGSSTGGAGQAAGSTSPQLLRVMLVQRLGVCGNGVCEVGERQLLNSEGEVLQEADTLCAQDCPGVIRLCPAPVGPVGDPDVECGGNGRCIRSTGTCDCFAGYTGTACDMCQASFWPTANRLCVPQYIAGRSIFTPEPPPPVRVWALVIAALLAVSLLAVMAVTLYNWLVRGVPPRTQLQTAMRKLRALVPVGWGRRAKEVLSKRAAAISAKLKLPLPADELLAGGHIKAHKEERLSLLAELPVSTPPGDPTRQRPWTMPGRAGRASRFEMGRYPVSSPGVLSTQRPSWATGSAAGADGDTFAPSAALHDDAGLLSLSGSTGLRLRSSRSSDGTGGSSDDVTPLSNAGSNISNAGGSPLSASLSGVVTAVQRGVSRAGRSVSGAVARLSIPGLTGYERLVNAVNLTGPGSPDSSPDGNTRGSVFRQQGRHHQQQQQFEEEMGLELQSTPGYRQSLGAQQGAGLGRQAGRGLYTGRTLQEELDADLEADEFFLPVSVQPAEGQLQPAEPRRARPGPTAASPPSGPTAGSGLPSPYRESFLHTQLSSSDGQGLGPVRLQAGLTGSAGPPAAVARAPPGVVAAGALPRGSRLGFGSSSGGVQQPGPYLAGAPLTAPDAAAAQGAGLSLQSVLQSAQPAQLQPSTLRSAAAPAAVGGAAAAAPGGQAAAARAAAVTAAAPQPSQQSGQGRPLRVLPPPRPSTASASSPRLSVAAGGQQPQQGNGRGDAQQERLQGAVRQPPGQPDLL